MFRLTIQWQPGVNHEIVLLNSMAGLSKTYTNRDDSKFVPVIFGQRIPGQGTYQDRYILCNKPKLKEFLREYYGEKGLKYD